MLSLSVISPTKKIFEISCKQITLPTQSGEITILPKHAPLMSLLSTGDVIIKTESDETQYILVHEGFINIEDDKVVLLVNFGAHSDELDEKIILEAKARAEKMLKESKSEEFSKVAMADLWHADLQLQFLSRRKHRGDTRV